MVLRSITAFCPTMRKMGQDICFRIARQLGPNPVNHLAGQKLEVRPPLCAVSCRHGSLLLGVNPLCDWHMAVHFHVVPLLRQC